MIFTQDDLATVRADLADARRRLAALRADPNATLTQTAAAQRWVTEAEELVKRVQSGLGNQNIQEAASILGAKVTKVDKRHA